MDRTYRDDPYADYPIDLDPSDLFPEIEVRKPSDKELGQIEELVKDTKTHLSNIRAILEKNKEYSILVEFIDIKYKEIDNIVDTAKKLKELGDK
jgi:hypothetical protein